MGFQRGKSVVTIMVCQSNLPPNAMKTMNISTLSQKSGLSSPTIRYYERIQLLPTPKRMANGYRYYSEQDLQQLLIIKHAQQAGFTLAQIKALLPAEAQYWQHDALLAALKSKIQEIEHLETKLAHDKQQLQTIILAIENKPDQISCAENAQRLLQQTRPTE